jgi:hypothetical protein
MNEGSALRVQSDSSVAPRAPTAPATPRDRFDPGTLSIGAVIGALVCAIVGTAFGMVVVTSVAAIALASVAAALSFVSAGGRPRSKP